MEKAGSVEAVKNRLLEVRFTPIILNVAADRRLLDCVLPLRLLSFLLLRGERNCVRDWERARGTQSRTGSTLGTPLGTILSQLSFRLLFFPSPFRFGEILQVNTWR